MHVEPRRAGDMSSGGHHYEQSVKRHLDVFDAQMALNEITTASSATHDFARAWSERAHHHQRSDNALDSLPDLQGIDEMMRQSSNMMDALTKIRDVVIAQQQALAEEKARIAQGEQYDEECGRYQDDFKASNFGANDGKKRRGVSYAANVEKSAC